MTKDKGTISLPTLWTEAELIAVQICVIEERPHADAARALRVSIRTIQRLIQSAFEAARDAKENGWDINFPDSDFVCPE